MHPALGDSGGVHAAALLLMKLRVALARLLRFGLARLLRRRRLLLIGRYISRSRLLSTAFAITALAVWANHVAHRQALRHILLPLSALCLVCLVL